MQSINHHTRLKLSNIEEWQIENEWWSRTSAKKSPIFQRIYYSPRGLQHNPRKYLGFQTNETSQKTLKTCSYKLIHSLVDEGISLIQLNVPANGVRRYSIFFRNTQKDKGTSPFNWCITNENSTSHKIDLFNWNLRKFKRELNICINCINMFYLYAFAYVATGRNTTCYCIYLLYHPTHEQPLPFYVIIFVIFFNIYCWLHTYVYICKEIIISCNSMNRLILL